MRGKRVAILGGGLLGSCLALALAERGVKTTVYDRGSKLLTRAAVANEGKIHFGYVYAGDTTLASARTMITGALSFWPFMERYVGISPDRLNMSSPFAYLVHRTTQRSVDDFLAHMRAVNGLVREALDAHPLNGYLDADFAGPIRRWSVSEIEDHFAPSEVLAVIDSAERAVDPFDLAVHLRERIVETPEIELRLLETVRAVEESGASFVVVSDGPEGASRERYNEVANALWEGRLAIDATLGIAPDRPWLHRFRYGLRLDSAAGMGTLPPSVTIVHGALGGLVFYEDGSLYLNWYPACRVSVSQELAAPDLPTFAAEPLRSRIIDETLSVLTDIVPSLRNLDKSTLDRAAVIGGTIFALGSTDIDDPGSRLHRRHEIGIKSVGRYHSIDPGKLTLAPHFAELCAERIAAG